MLDKLKELFKDFKFTVLKLEDGNEMIRTSWFGRHNYVPYIRVDLWKIGFRISYDPDYYARYWFEIKDYLRMDQHQRVLRYIEERTSAVDQSKFVTESRGGKLVKEPIGLWKDVCKFAENMVEY